MCANDCPSGKIRWPSQHWATHFAYERGNRAPVRVYYCPECGGWHQTSQPFAHREWMTRHLIDNGQLIINND